MHESYPKKDQLVDSLPKSVERKLFDFVAKRPGHDVVDTESQLIVRRLQMHEIRNEYGARGIRIGAIPNPGSLEIIMGGKPNTYTVRYVEIVPLRKGEEVRERFKKPDVDEKDLESALEDAWKVCIERSGKVPRTDVLEPHSPGDGGEERRRQLGTRLE